MHCSVITRYKPYLQKYDKICMANYQTNKIGKFSVVYTMLHSAFVAEVKTTKHKFMVLNIFVFVAFTVSTDWNPAILSS
jgi:hypothetical protein